MPLSVDTATVFAPRVPATAYPPSSSVVPSEVSMAAPVSSSERRGALTRPALQAAASCDSSRSSTFSSTPSKVVMNAGMPRSPARLIVSFPCK